MIISRTPFRISFFGGGTDYPAWYRAHGGAVLATTINKYCYISCRYLPPFFDHRHRIAYSRIETPNLIDEVLHPAVREVMRHLDIERGVAISHDGDLPARGGVGSSSAFTVGLLNALYALKGRIPSRHDLATESIWLEQERLKETVGSQDQVLAAYGGFNHVQFHTSGQFTVRPMTVAPDALDALNDRLMLFFTGIKRTASNIAGSYANDVDRNEAHLRSLMQLTDDGVAALAAHDLPRFGDLLHEAWQAKRSLSPMVSNPEIEEIYTEARRLGARGGKVIGAGGGGFILLYVEPADQTRVKERLSKLIHVPFRFEHSGSSIIFYDPETDYSVEHRARDAEAITPFREAHAPDPGWDTGPTACDANA